MLNPESTERTMMQPLLAFARAEIARRGLSGKVEASVWREVSDGSGGVKLVRVTDKDPHPELYPVTILDEWAWFECNCPAAVCACLELWHDQK